MSKVFGNNSLAQAKPANEYIVDKIFDFTKLKKITPSFILSICLILLIGVVALYSANFATKTFFMKQLASVPMMFIVFSMVVCLHPILLRRYAYEVYFVSLFLLSLTYFLGKTTMGGKRWLGFGAFQIQPSEFMKIGVILFMAKYFSTSRMKDIGSIKKMLIPLGACGAACGLTVIQPDLGTGMIIASLSIIILFISGVKIWKFVASGVLIIIATPIIWGNLHDYQKQRIEIFLNPEHDILNTGYNINQAKIAIGNGGFFGTGVGLGSQTKSQFVPENKTDFIFTVIGEEMGFVGMVALITLYLSISYYGTYVSNLTNDFFLKIVCYGSASLLFLHAIINMGMNIGIFPAVGIPLPLVSYGRSSMLTSFIILGLIGNAFVNKNSNLK